MIGGGARLTTERQAVKALADNIVKTLKSMVDDNNKTYVNNQIKNYTGVMNTSGYSGPIQVSQVKGLYNYMIGSLTNAITEDDPTAAQLILALQGIASLQVHELVTDVARIDELYATYGEFVNLVAQEATIGDLDVAAIHASMAEIGLANISSANISTAQIKIASTDTAFIRQGVGNKMYIDSLVVEEANIVNLSVGNLMIADENGNLVKIKVDANGNVERDEHNHVVTGIVTFEGDNIVSSGSYVTKASSAPLEPNIGDIWCDTSVTPNVAKTWSGSAWVVDATINIDSLVDGEYYGTITGEKIRNASINASELNVESIFAQNAVVMDLIANNINAVTLFANQGVIPQLKSSIISSLNDSQFNNSLGSGISKISLLEGLIGLVVENEDTSSEIELTPGMISAMSDNIVISADKIDAIADEIDLSGNDSVSITSTNQISASVANNLDLTSNSSITLLEGLIGLIVENEDTSSAIELTSGMISAMSENIVIAASKINAIADEINLESNGSVQTVVNTTLTDELDDEEIQAAIVQTVTASAAFDDYKTEVSTMVSQTADDLSVLIGNTNDRIDGIDQNLTWFKFTQDGLGIGKEGSWYTTLTDGDGFHIYQVIDQTNNISEKIGSFAKRQLKAEEVRVGSLKSTGNRCVLREAYDGGLMITVEGLV